MLLALAFPIAVGTTLLAEPIILILAGPGYLPESAWALQILIWYLPISFVNGLLQYVLIAVNRQRTLSVAFARRGGVQRGGEPGADPDATATWRRRW